MLTSVTKLRNSCFPIKYSEVLQFLHRNNSESDSIFGFVDILPRLVFMFLRVKLPEVLSSNIDSESVRSVKVRLTW